MLNKDNNNLNIKNKKKSYLAKKLLKILWNYKEMIEG